MDKLYSRKRIKVPDFKKINSIKAMLLIIFAWTIISVCLFLKSAYPVFKSSCETAASSKGNKIISEEVRKVMQEYTYNDLIHIDKDISGKIDSNVVTEFKSVGINQTHHKIYMKIHARVGILTPFSSFGKDIDQDILISEAIIVGEVPETYYNLEGMDEADDTFNFIE